MDICFWEEVDTGDYYESECNKKVFQFNDGNPYDMCIRLAAFFRLTPELSRAAKRIRLE